MIAGAPVPQSSSIKLLGVTLDETLSFDSHISEVCRAYHLKAFKHIRKSLDKSTANMIACSYIASRLDYCNAVLAGVTDHNIMRLQRVQNAAAKVVLNVHGRTNSAACLQELHWLPITQRIRYKIALTVYKTLTTNQPAYLKSMLSISEPVRSLRSSSNGVMLDVPFCKTVNAARAFSINAPRIWNALPKGVRDSLSITDDTPQATVEVFKKLLKTVLFSAAFDTPIT
jgi:hypothetical protein